MEFTVIVIAIFAFAVLIMGAAMAHYLDTDLDPDYYDGPYLPHEDETPMCEECNADGPDGECTVCGYMDALAIYTHENRTEVK